MLSASATSWIEECPQYHQQTIPSSPPPPFSYQPDPAAAKHLDHYGMADAASFGSEPSSQWPPRIQPFEWEGGGEARGMANYDGGFHGATEGRAELRRLLAPLNKSQLIELLVRLAQSVPEARSRIIEVASQSRAHRRLYVKNLAYATDDSQLRHFFSSFGETEEAVVVRDGYGRSRGYGFVTFLTREAAVAAIQSNLSLDGRRIIVGLASDPTNRTSLNPFADFTSPGPVDVSACPGGGTNDLASRKLFIRNLNQRTSCDAVRRVFEQEGEVDDVTVLHDRYGRSKGFGFVTYRDTDSAQQVLLEPQRIVDGQIVFVHLASERSAVTALPSSPPLQPHGQHSHGSFRPPHISRPPHHDPSAAAGAAGMAPSNALFPGPRPHYTRPGKRPQQHDQGGGGGGVMSPDEYRPHHRQAAFDQPKGQHLQDLSASSRGRVEGTTSGHLEGFCDGVSYEKRTSHARHVINVMTPPSSIHPTAAPAPAPSSSSPLLQREGADVPIRSGEDPYLNQWRDLPYVQQPQQEQHRQQQQQQQQPPYGPPPPYGAEEMSTASEYATARTQEHRSEYVDPFDDPLTDPILALTNESFFKFE
ncbi:unnamed protein product [Vitrella brassicaformis CCMP3155]|uniref:RRM domain-containing protein n=2 Tax=Vitrella brassicaformis TaxID=1169539 RepID=A0A0G4EG64_VITBC|nr:unnamed protein product [Vitrella brassicaformis CCMP3155]|mmetsp:Transcript_23338/g.66940  ORF Transcript_23338/g.66940 Transcript_23338/m.66940 type:complete len:589 (+) Transcript_23338:51-1817(+)|eukprot:CEL94707.1 unnamed protein product [Vitrella brassicaformis CCMP3155]